MANPKRHETYDFILRTTLDHIYEGDLPYSGVYIIAYMGKILYVGKVENGMTDRLIYHMKYGLSPIGCWLNVMEPDWKNVRLDILEPPTDQYEDRHWLTRIENACIKQFNPLFNKQLMSEKPPKQCFRFSLLSKA